MAWPTNIVQAQLRPHPPLARYRSSATAIEALQLTAHVDEWQEQSSGWHGHLGLSGFDRSQALRALQPRGYWIFQPASTTLAGSFRAIPLPSPSPGLPPTRAAGRLCGMAAASQSLSSSCPSAAAPPQPGAVARARHAIDPSQVWVDGGQRALSAGATPGGSRRGPPPGRSSEQLAIAPAVQDRGSKILRQVWPPFPNAVRAAQSQLPNGGPF